MVKINKFNIKNKRILKIFNIFLFNYFNLVIVFTVMLVAAVGFFCLIKPKYTSVFHEIQSTDEAMEAEYNDLEKYFLKLKKYKSAYDEISEKDKKKIEIMLPENSAHENLFTQLEAFISHYGFTLTSLQINSGGRSSPTKRNVSRSKSAKDKSSLSKTSEIGEIKVTMGIDGVNSYKTFKDLLAIIENNLRLMDIEQLSFSPDMESISLPIKMYYLK